MSDLDSRRDGQLEGRVTRDSDWHLRQAERLLEQAYSADLQRHPGDVRRWSYAERADRHASLARSIAYVQWLHWQQREIPAPCKCLDRGLKVRAAADLVCRRCRLAFDPASATDVTFLGWWRRVRVYA